MTNSRYNDSIVDWQNVSTNRFDGGKTVTVLTHGWTAEWDDSSFLNNGRDAFKRKNVNYLGLDWSGGSQTLDYPLAAANTQIAGRAIAYLFNQLKRSGFRDNQFHCAGHSLGGHVCSYAAKYAKSEFGITMSRLVQ